MNKLELINAFKNAITEGYAACLRKETQALANQRRDECSMKLALFELCFDLAYEAGKRDALQEKNLKTTVNEDK